MKIAVLIVILFCFCSMGLFLDSLPREMVVGYHKDFSPYFYENKSGLNGIFPDMIKEAAKKMGITVRYQKYPWKRMLRSAEEGEVDAIMPLFKNPEREKYLVYPEAGIALGESFFFTRKDFNLNYSGDLRELRPYIIGFVTGYSYGEEFDQADYLQKDESPSDEALVEKVLKGRCQLGVGPKSVVNFYAKKLGNLDKIEFLRPTMMRKILYLAFSKKRANPQLIARFSAAVEALGRDGTHQKILKKYRRGEDMAFFKELVIGADQEDYHPYSYWENGHIKGACPDLIIQAAKLLGVKIQFKKIKWQEFPTLIGAGSIDAITPPFKTAEREKYLYFPSNGLIVEKNCLFTLKNSNISYSGDLNQLRNISIGVIDKYSYGGGFDNASFLKKRSFSSLDELLDRLMQEKVKAVVGNDRAIQYIAKRKGIFEAIKKIGPAFPWEFLHVAFSKGKGKGYKKLADSFSRAIAKVRKTEQYQDILNRHQIQKRVVHLAADDWPPYYGENLPSDGPIAEIVVGAFRRVGYQSKIEFMPRADLLGKVKNGQYDAGFAASVTKQRMQDYTFSDRLVQTAPFVVYQRVDSAVIVGRPEDLANYRIGVTSNIVYPSCFYEIKGLQLLEAANTGINFRKLLNDYIDLVVSDQRHASYLLDRMPGEKNKLTSLPLCPDQEVRKPMHLFFFKQAKGAEQVRIDFNYGLKQISEDGTLDRILKKHGLNDEIEKN